MGFILIFRGHLVLRHSCVGKTGFPDMTIDCLELEGITWACSANTTLQRVSSKIDPPPYPPKRRNTFSKGSTDQVSAPARETVCTYLLKKLVGVPGVISSGSRSRGALAARCQSGAAFLSSQHYFGGGFPLSHLEDQT